MAAEEKEQQQQQVVLAVRVHNGKNGGAGAEGLFQTHLVWWW